MPVLVIVGTSRAAMRRSDSGNGRASRFRSDRPGSPKSAVCRVWLVNPPGRAVACMFRVRWLQRHQCADTHTSRGLGVSLHAMYWSWRWDSNPQPADYKSAALPIELCQHKSNAEFNLYFEFCQSFEGIEVNFTSGFRLPGGWDRLRPSGREEELEPHDRC